MNDELKSQGLQAAGSTLPEHADLYDVPPSPEVSGQGAGMPGNGPAAADAAQEEHAPQEGGGVKRPDGFPDLHSHRQGRAGVKQLISIVAFLVILLGGGFWTVYRVVASHQAQVKHERDTVADAPQGGRAFDQTPPVTVGAASAPVVASVPAVAGPAVPVQPVQAPAGQPHMVQAPRPMRSWYDADLTVDGAQADVAVSGAGNGNAGADTGGNANGGAGRSTGAASNGLAGNGSGAGNPLVAALSPTTFHAAKATQVGNRDLLLSAGAKIPCAGDTAFDSTLAGVSTCTVTSDVYSDNGHVVLIERGSTINTEFRSTPSQGQKRVFIVSARIRTPDGVTAEIDSPAADALGRMGIDGDVDNHWGERIGAAFLLSLVQDSIGYLASRSSSSNGTVVFQNTQQTGNDMASKVLNSTINIPPTITKNQGADFLIVLARDIDFGNVYQLEAK